MTQGQNIDGVLPQWGDRLCSPSNRIVHARLQPRLSALAEQQRVRLLPAGTNSTNRP